MSMAILTDPQLLFGMQFSLSFAIAAMVGRWYAVPALKRLPLHESLVPLFMVQALRYLPSSALAPGQVDAGVPWTAMSRIAGGDLAVSLFAFAVILFLR